MKGFFTKQQPQSQSRPDGRSYSCISCGLYKNALSPKMKPFGNFKKRILNIGEAPGEAEDQEGKQWQGRAGRLLQRKYRELGIDLFDDCLNINAVNCRPPGNKTPSNYEIACCNSVIVNKVITEYAPEVIVLLGKAAVTSFLKHRWKKDLGGITKWCGWTIPDRDYRAWVCPVFHPSYIMRTNSQEAETIWRQDLQQAFEKVGTTTPTFKKPNIHFIEDLSPLDDIHTDLVGIDYETTGLKPHAKGHRIVAASVAYDDNNAYSFMLPEKKSERMPLIRLWQNGAIGKVASNMKFEDHWTYHRLHRTEIKGWEFDTMLAAHIIDNRPGVTSLKFLAYQMFGIVDYDSEIAPYLRSKDAKNGNGFNRIYELLEKPGGKEKLLTYVGWDALLELRAARIQMKKIGYDSLPF